MVVLYPLLQFVEIGLHLPLAPLRNLSRVDSKYFHCVFQSTGPSHWSPSSFLPSWPWKRREGVLLLFLRIWPSSFFSHSLVWWISWQDISLSKISISYTCLSNWFILWVLGLLEESFSVGSSCSFGVADGSFSATGIIYRARSAPSSCSSSESK